jgi:hypothetical protein
MVQRLAKSTKQLACEYRDLKADARCGLTTIWVRGVLTATLAVALVPFPAGGQEGTAEPGYYPSCFNGDTFTGLLSATNDATRQITLTYTAPKDAKTQTFVAAIDEDYTVSRQGGPQHQLRPSELPPGKPLTVFYCTEHKKIDGNKIAVHTVFLIKAVTNYAKFPVKYEAF